MRHLNPRELKSLLDKQEPLFLLDVREEWEYETCHIAGSHLIPMRDIPQHLNTLNPQHAIVVICHHGVRSLQVAHFLERSGFTQVLNLTGGVAAWADFVDPMMPTY